MSLMDYGSKKRPSIGTTKCARSTKKKNGNGAACIKCFWCSYLKFWLISVSWSGHQFVAIGYMKKAYIHVLDCVVWIRKSPCAILFVLLLFVCVTVHTHSHNCDMMQTYTAVTVSVGLPIGVQNCTALLCWVFDVWNDDRVLLATLWKRGTVWTCQVISSLCHLIIKNVTLIFVLSVLGNSDLWKWHFEAFCFVLFRFYRNANQAETY